MEKTEHKWGNKFRKMFGGSALTDYVQIDEKENPDQLRPIYEGDNKLVKFIPMHSGSFVLSNNEYPIVGTGGLGPCIAFCGYDPEKKMAFMAHIAPSDDYKSLINKLQIDMRENCGPLKNIEAYLVGGNFWTSNKLSEIKKFALKNFKMKSLLEDTSWVIGLPRVEEMKTIPANIEEENYRGKSILIDSRDGKVTSINPCLYRKAN